MLSVEEVLHRLDEESCTQALSLEWEASQTALPREGIDFLQPQQVRDNLLACGFGEEAVAPTLAAAARIQADPALAALIWHCAWRVYESNDEHWLNGWPKLEKALGPAAGLFYLLVGIAEAPRVRAFHRGLGIPAEVTQETLREPLHFSQNYAEMSGGRLGLPLSQLFWLRYYTREKYFRLGRYEFWLKPLEWDLRVLRSRATGRVVALAAGDQRFDEQGFRLSDTDPAAPGEWRSRLLETPERLTGCPIDPRGFAWPDQVTLDLAEWEVVLRRGDWVLDMHIPAGGGMSPAAVHASFRRAAEFFPRHFPATPPVAYICWSWIYNPGLADILPAESNLVRNLDDAYLLPVESDPDDGLGFMFYQEKFDPAGAPRKTSLQRAILAYLARGGRWRCGSMFYLIADLNRLGTAVYQVS